MSWIILLFVLLVTSIKNRGSKTMTVSVVIPAYNESKTVEKVIKVINSLDCVSEIIVVDDGSSDETAKAAQNAGATVIVHSKNKGKGAAIKTGFENSTGDVVAFIDADLKNLTSRQVEKIVKPILDGKADITKTKFKRKAGRVTELTAKPLLNFFFPELKYDQPLSGQFAAKRTFLSKIKFEEDYGVDIGIILDADVRGMRIKEVDIGEIEHIHSSIEGLNKMANEVVRTIVDRSIEYGRFSMMDDLGKNIRMSILGLSLITLGIIAMFFVDRIPPWLGELFLIAGLIVAIYYTAKLVKSTFTILRRSNGRLPTLKSLMYMHFPILVSGLILLTMISALVGSAQFNNDGTVSIQPVLSNLVIGPSGLLEIKEPYKVDRALENEYNVFRVPANAMDTLDLNYGDIVYTRDSKYTLIPSRQDEENTLRMPSAARKYLGIDEGTVILDNDIKNRFKILYIEKRILSPQGNIDNLTIDEGVFITSSDQSGRIVNIYVDGQKVATTYGVFHDGPYGIYINNVKYSTFNVDENNVKSPIFVYWGNHTIKIEVGDQTNSYFEFARSDQGQGKFLNIFIG